MSCSSAQMLSWAGLGWPGLALLGAHQAAPRARARPPGAGSRGGAASAPGPTSWSPRAAAPAAHPAPPRCEEGGRLGGALEGGEHPAGRPTGIAAGYRAAGHGRRVAGSMRTTPEKKSHPTAGSPSTISPTSTETSLAASAAAATPLEQRSGAAGWPVGRQSGHPRLRAAISDPLSWWKAAAAASCDRGAALAACRGAATPRPSVERASRRTPQASSVILKRPKGASGHLKAAHGVLLLFSRLGELLINFCCFFGCVNRTVIYTIVPEV